MIQFVNIYWPITLLLKQFLKYVPKLKKTGKKAEQKRPNLKIVCHFCVKG